MPLLLKVTCWIDEPLQWKGGRLAALYKHKGSPADCANHRAILISSTLEKSVHNIFRVRAVPFARAAASQLQFSAHAGANVSLAAHVVRLHQSLARSRHSSEYTVFLDIASAYYTLFRQHIVSKDPIGNEI